jgi:hypothetical protein
MLGVLCSIVALLRWSMVKACLLYLCLVIASCTSVVQRSTQLLESIYNQSMGVRIGLLSPDHQSLLLVLPTQLAVRGSREQHSGARTAVSCLQGCIVP